MSDEDYSLIKDHVQSLISLSLCGGNEHDCGYCKGKDTSVSFGFISFFMSCSNYQALIDRGWRRSGKYLYKPDMVKTCCPQYTIRLQAKNFKLSKGQKKILIKFNRYIQGEWSPDKEQLEKHEQKKPPKDNTPKGLSDLINAINKTDNKYNLKIELEPSSFTKEKYELYEKYQTSIHHDEKERISKKGFCRFLVDSPLKFEKKSQMQYGSFHQKYILDGKLIALSVVDILPNCVSAVYFMYDPDYAFLGLGKYSALKEIALVQELNQKAPSLQYYYMGFYIDSCPKMNYKGQYEPSDLLDPVDYSWHSIEEFKRELKNHQFVTFSKGSNNRKNGWLNSKEVTQQVLSTVDVYIGNGSKLPAKELLELINDSKIKGFLVNYVCAVGLTLASDMMVTF